MSALREKESKILTSLSNSPKSLLELAEELGAGFSKTTVHRIVTSLAKDGRIVASGSGRSAKYEITSVGRLFNPITPDLIAQGAGWTISRASTILQNKGLMNEILYLPMPEPLLVRKVYVLTRQNEPSALMQEFTQLACSILKESVAPELIKIAPWLEQDIFVLDPTSGVMVDMTGKKAEER